MSVTMPLCQMWHIGQQHNHAKTLPILSQFFNGAPVVFELIYLLLHHFAPCCFNMIALFYACPPVSITLLLLLRCCYTFEKHAQSPSSFADNHAKLTSSCLAPLRSRSLESFPDQKVLRNRPVAITTKLLVHCSWFTFQMIG